VNVAASSSHAPRSGSLVLVGFLRGPPTNLDTQKLSPLHRRNHFAPMILKSLGSDLLCKPRAGATVCTFQPLPKSIW